MGRPGTKASHPHMVPSTTKSRPRLAQNMFLICIDKGVSGKADTHPAVFYLLKFQSKQAFIK